MIFSLTLLHLGSIRLDNFQLILRHLWHHFLIDLVVLAMQMDTHFLVDSGLRTYYFGNEVSLLGSLEVLKHFEVFFVSF